MASLLTWYTVRLVLTVDPAEEGRRAVHDLQEDLEQRPYLRDALVSWEDAHSLVMVEVATEGVDAAQVATLMEEELLEVASGVLGNVTGASVRLLAVTSSPSPDRTG